MIEEYLKKALQEEGRIEIKRNQIASLFDCVPSQINYVINTRFTLQHGYTVESKRGGGGYIRIVEMQVNNNAELLERMSQLIGNEISEKKAQTLIQTIYEGKFMTRREAHIMLAAIDEVNYSSNENVDQKIRAKILLSMIKLLILKNK